MAKSPGILVTRPQEQADGLCRRIESLGWRAIRFPLIAIEPIDLSVIDADTYDLLIFISRNAVIYGLPLIQNRSNRQRLAAVGRGTAAELVRCHLEVDLLPDSRWDSEGLLALPELQQVDGKRILILRGEGGRPLLGDTLRARGARLDYAEVYRRALPEIETENLLRYWPQIDLLLATSNGMLDNLMVLLGRRAPAMLTDKTLLVVSERGKRHARGLGLQRVIRADGASDQALVAAMLQWAEDGNLEDPENPRGAAKDDR